MSQTYDQALQIGEVLNDQYRIDAILGEGGFGITYKAHDMQLDRTVVIKEFLPQDFAARGTDTKTVQARTNRNDDYQHGLEGFLEEAKALAKFQHPHIVHVNYFFEANGTAYLIMNYAEGMDLSEWLKQQTSQPDEDTILNIITPIVDGLIKVHEAGLLHRDIKLGNIYLRDEGGAMLIDFGAARQALGEASKSMSAIISMGYAPPEQYMTRGKQSAATDLYAIGAVLYKLITGDTPVESTERSHDIHEGDADPLKATVKAGAGKVSDWLLELTDQLLEISQKQRPQTATQVLNALKNKTALANEVKTTEKNKSESGNKTRVVKSSERFKKNTKEPKLTEKSSESEKTFSAIKWGAGVVVLALLGIGGFYTNQQIEKTRMEEQARIEEQAKLDEQIRKLAQVRKPVNTGRLEVEKIEKYIGKMIVVPAGKYRMGKKTSEGEVVPGVYAQIRAFKLGSYEVTQELWRAVKGRNPSQFKYCDACPVERVSWNDVQNFLQILNQKTGKKFRLPTEAEWEYACRSGGKEQKYCGGKSVNAVAWYNGNSNRKTHMVGTKQPNELGFYDMSGNVWEWTQDCFSRQSDYCDRVLRGGSWLDFPDEAISSARELGSYSSGNNASYGFRLAQDLE